MRTYARAIEKESRMNKIETDYAGQLELQRRVDAINSYAFEPLKLRLADNTYYTPDFLVCRDDGVLECHEVKGYWREDARVKIKAAAELFPFRFVAVTRDRGVWQFEEIGRAEKVIEEEKV